jgi:hypothetical protein
MDKPEYCWIDLWDANLLGTPGMVSIWGSSMMSDDSTKWRITYNEAGEVVKLERVEG